LGKPRGSGKVQKQGPSRRKIQDKKYIDDRGGRRKRERSRKTVGGQRCCEKQGKGVVPGGPRADRVNRNTTREGWVSKKSEKRWGKGG